MIAPKAMPISSISSDHERRVHPAPQQRGGGDRGERHHAADRKVDPAGEDDEGHPDRADQQEGVVAEQVEEHLRIPHARERPTKP